MSFRPFESLTSSHVLFLCRASISSCITVIYLKEFELFNASWKFEGSLSSVRRQYALWIFITYFDYRDGFCTWHVDRQTPPLTAFGSFSSSFYSASEESLSLNFSSICIVAISVKVLSFLCSVYNSFSTKTTSLLTTLRAVGSHRREIRWSKVLSLNSTSHREIPWSKRPFLSTTTITKPFFLTI